MLDSYIAYFLSFFHQPLKSLNLMCVFSCRSKLKTLQTLR